VFEDIVLRTLLGSTAYSLQEINVALCIKSILGTIRGSMGGGNEDTEQFDVYIEAYATTASH
jgi:hypothetical protein